ncbi:hypothetical protein B0H13DRAFT_1159605 [Mycena leptocephala]|nr:hypothetical protein B0H13DRAFT_1159605 [Mycena leptocephala]
MLPRVRRQRQDGGRRGALLARRPPRAAARGDVRCRRRCRWWNRCGGYRKGDGLFDAARRGGFLDMPTSPSGVGAGAGYYPGMGTGAYTGPGGTEHTLNATANAEKRLSGNALMSGTGVTEVNRLVAELERRRSATPSPRASPGGTPPITPTYGTYLGAFTGGSGRVSPSPAFAGSGGEGREGEGRASPSQLGSALAKIADGHGHGAGVYGAHLEPGSAHGSHHNTPPYAGSGRVSPLLPLGIAVDEVDKERRRRSGEFGALAAGGGDFSGVGGVIVLGEEDEEEDAEEEGKAPRTPSPQILYDGVSATHTSYFAPKPAGYTSPTAGNHPIPPTGYTAPTNIPPSFSRRRSVTPNVPVRAYADDDDAELFPLPSASSGSRNSTPRDTPRGTPQASPAASASDVSVTLPSGAAAKLGTDGGTGVTAKRLSSDGSVNVNAKRLSRGSPKAGALLPAALTGAARERDASSPPLSPRDREKSRSEAVCVALGSTGRREREERERAEREREREPSGGDKGVPMAKCARGLLLPPGDERECDSSASSSSREGSRAGSREGSCDRESASSDAEGEGRDLERPLPVLARLATSVLAAGPYSPALAPRSYAEDVHLTANAGKSSHLRVASAPASTSSSSTSAPTASSSTTAPPGRSANPPSLVSSESDSAAATTPTRSRTKSASTSSTSPTTPKPPARSATLTNVTSLQPPPQQGLRRASSFARLRSTSTSSSGPGSGSGGVMGKGGRKAFGALVDVLKGVTSLSGGGGVAV